MIITMVNAIYAIANNPPKKLSFRSSHHLYLSFLSRVKMNSDELIQQPFHAVCHLACVAGGIV